MAKPTQPLTDEQRKLAEQYHNLIFRFLHRNSLQVDEWYDIAAIGFVKAIRYHKPERPYPISALAFRCMRDEMVSEYRRQSCKKRTATVISLDTPIYEGGAELHEFIAGHQSAEDDYFMHVNLHQKLLHH